MLGYVGGNQAKGSSDMSPTRDLNLAHLEFLLPYRQFPLTISSSVSCRELKRAIKHYTDLNCLDLLIPMQDPNANYPVKRPRLGKAKRKH